MLMRFSCLCGQPIQRAHGFGQGGRFQHARATNDRALQVRHFQPIIVTLGANANLGPNNDAKLIAVLSRESQAGIASALQYRQSSRAMIPA